MHPSSGPRLCAYCTQWQLATTDLYCASCGQLSLELRLQPEQVILVSSLPQSHNRVLVLSNEDSRSLQLEVIPQSPRPWLSHKPPKLSIPAGGKARIDLHLRPEHLPDSFRQEHYQFRLVIDGNTKLFRTFGVTVRSGPRPVVDSVRFGELQEGTVQESTLSIRNEGGLPFKVVEIEPAGSPQLQVGDVALPMSVESGQQIAIPVSWDTNIPHDGGVSAVVFRVHLATGDVIEAPAKASLYRYRLVANPAQVRLEGTTKTQPSQWLEIQNLGSIDVEIGAIESPAPWLSVAESLPFTLRALDPADHSLASRRRIRVVATPEGLSPGEHESSLEIAPKDKDLSPLSIEVELQIHALETYKDYIGIDFGTTNSVVSVLDSEDTPVLVEIEDDQLNPSPLIPSILAFRPDGSSHIGYQARSEAGGNPELSVRSIKRAMGYETEIHILGRQFQPEDIAALILKHLRAYAEQRLLELQNQYFDVQRAIITVPANFYGLQIEALLNACEKAGIQSDRLVTERATDILRQNVGIPINGGIILAEPSAAAVYFINYLAQHRNLETELTNMVNRESGMHLVVYDYGGGTLDISVAKALRLPDGSVGLEILASRGKNHLGGDHLDILLMRDFLASALVAHPEFDPSLIDANFQDIQQRKSREGWSSDDWQKILSARHSWKAAAESLKIRLAPGVLDKASETLPGSSICHFDDGRLNHASKELQLTLERSHMEQRLAPPLDQGIELVQQALDVAGVGPSNVDFVLHAGRQSLMKVVQDRVRALFPEAAAADRIILDEKRLLKTCVAQGAALYGRQRDGISGGTQLIRENKLPIAYGIGHPDDFGQLQLDEVIALGEEYPLSREKVLDQLPPTGRLNLKLYENSGTSRRIANNPEIQPVGAVGYDFDPVQEQSLSLKLTIDPNRRLAVQIGDKELDIKLPKQSNDSDWMG